MIRNIAAILLVVVWMSVIFIFSNAIGSKSSESSDKVVEVVMDVIGKKDDTENYKELKKNISFIVRKCAHFIEYFILGLLLMNMIFVLDIKTNRIILPIIIVICYAISDELHQFFIADRSMQISDIILDSIAGIIAIVTYYRLIVLRYEHEKIGS